MTISEYAKIEENFKNEVLGKFIEFDGNGNFQCWDLNEYYNVNYLGVPASVLAGCGYVSNMLYPPKINDLLEYFDEVDVHKMIKGDTVIWDKGGIAPLGHIAVYDHWDGTNCWFVTQNSPIGTPTILTIIEVDAGARAFRLKGIVPDPEPVPPTPEPTEFKVGDYVVPTLLVDYQGTPLIQYDDLYQIVDKDERGNVLAAVRGNDRPIWAVLPDANIKKAD